MPDSCPTCGAPIVPQPQEHKGGRAPNRFGEPEPLHDGHGDDGRMLDGVIRFPEET